MPHVGGHSSFSGGSHSHSHGGGYYHGRGGIIAFLIRIASIPTFILILFIVFSVRSCTHPISMINKEKANSVALSRYAEVFESSKNTYEDYILYHIFYDEKKQEAYLPIVCGDNIDALLEQTYTRKIIDFDNSICSKHDLPTALALSFCYPNNCIIQTVHPISGEVMFTKYNIYTNDSNKSLTHQYPKIINKTGCEFNFSRIITIQENVYNELSLSVSFYIEPVTKEVRKTAREYIFE